MKQEINTNNILLADHIGCETLVGYMNDSFPMPNGNCFDLHAEEKYYRIVNFNAENLRELIKRGLTFPIKIVPIADHKAVIHDERIPDAWYQNRWCQVCCPEDLLPLPQQLEHDRQSKTGERTTFSGESGYIYIKTDRSKAPKF